MKKTFATAALVGASLLVAGPAMAATVVQAGDAGASSSAARPQTNAAATAFDLAVGNPIRVGFEAPQTYFTYSSGSVTSTPAGNGNALYAYNTTVGGQNVLQVSGGNVTFNFAEAITSFGAILTGVQLSNLSFAFNDGSSQSFAITNYGSGAQFFGLSNFARPIQSITLNASNDIIGVDDIRFTTAAAAVPEPATWALMILGMGAVGFAMRRRNKVNTTVRFA